jgi:hypothetical protein
MLEYHHILVDKFKISPWFSTTAPAYVHTVVKQLLSDNLELPEVGDERTELVNKLAADQHWAVLLPNEYWFARRALRGGRTDVRKVHHEVSQSDWARGVRIRYQDIVSMYPYVQVARDYPVGLPDIHVWDDVYYPCFKHRNPTSGNVASMTCTCSIQAKKAMSDRLICIVDRTPTPSVDQILADDSFFGIVCASLTPPTTLYHPVLVSWDEESKKCIASLEPIHGGVFTSMEFKKALSLGYRLDTLHRFDKYKKAPGLWNPFIKNLYIEKMANSEPTPSIETQRQLVRDYETDFEMGPVVKDSFPTWGYNPAKRQVFKIMLNSGWGKHCQRAIMPQTIILNREDDETMSNIFENITRGKVQLTGFDQVGEHTMIRSSDLGANTNPELHDSYLPAGLFVPAYGRMMLYEQLEQLGQRVLYHDTDSIVYIYDPDEYNIPESDVWGKWSVEKFDSKNGGIRTFVGLGPKSYGLKAANGENYIKIKGLSLKLAHEDMINFGVMEQMVKTYLDNKSLKTIQIPQYTFGYIPGRPIFTRQYLKNLNFNVNDLKGTLHPDGRLFPFGYCNGCFNSLGNQEAHDCMH